MSIIIKTEYTANNTLKYYSIILLAKVRICINRGFFIFIFEVIDLKLIPSCELSKI